MSCYNISQTDSRQEKNEIFVETVGSTAFGAATTIALGIYFLATPTGWVTALVLGAAAAGGSFVAGNTGRYVYDRYLNKHDLVSATGVDRLCR